MAEYNNPSKMELLDPNSEKTTRDSVSENSVIDRERGFISVAKEDSENKHMMIQSCKKPESPKGVTINNKDLLIHWDVSPCSLHAIDFFEIQWKKTEEKRWPGRKFTNNNSTSITVPITELERNTPYQFRVRWTTKEGVESPFSDISDHIIIQASHKPETPKGVTHIDQGLLLSWDVPSADLQAIDFFEVLWKKSEEKKWSGRKLTENNSRSITIPITDLETNVAFQFKVRWITKEGVESPFSDISDDIVINISHKPGKPRGVIHIDQGLVLSWDVSSPDLQATDFFELQWKKREEKKWSGRKFTDSNLTTTTIPITDLEKNVAFQFKVRWTTKEGVEGPFSDISDDIIVSMSRAPEKPKGVISNNKDLYLTWNVSSSDLQAIDFFEILWKKKEEQRWQGRKCTDDNSTSITIPITQLEQNATYQFKVRWTTTEGVESSFSDISDEIIIKLSQKPGKPKVVKSRDEELSISWDVPSSDLQEVEFFEIQWKKKDDTRWSGRKCTNENSTSITIPTTDLEKNAAYHFKVRWTTNKGSESIFSDESDDVVILKPMKPSKPCVVITDDEDLEISWDVSPSDLEIIAYFEIQWKRQEDKMWIGRKCISDNSRSITFSTKEFENNVKYQFKVRWVTHEENESAFSEISDYISIMPKISKSDPKKPGKVICLNLTSNTARLQWEEPKNTENPISYYEVKYRECVGTQWSNENTKGPCPWLEIKELKSNSLYQFKVRAIMSDGNEGPFSDISDDMLTQESLATRVLQIAKKEHDGKPPIYRLTLEFPQNSINTKLLTRKAVFGSRNPVHSTKTIMMVGATGAGKSTLIEGMVNYILNVAWDDDFRFSVIDVTDDEKKLLQTQANSQTKWITCYEINYHHGSQVTYNLNIVDTPGFGDTEGIERDKKIVDQIHEFFKAPGDQGIDSIDAVCFVTQAPLARLTPTQKYIFDSVLSIFGKDIKDNIFVLITFADGKEPPVLAALREAEVPFIKSFVFNNSALFACTNSSNEAKFTQNFWKLGVASFDIFFDELKYTQQKSLQLTSEVLELRRRIEHTIERLQPQIQDGINKLNTMKKETEILEKHKRDIEENKNFVYDVEEIHQRKVATEAGHYVTNCFVCNFTCHPDCQIADDDKKDECIAMEDGNCTVCPQNCHWSKHRNNDFYYETYPVKVTKTYDNLKAKYQSAVNNTKKQQSLLGSIKSSLKKMGRQVISKIQTVRNYINKLDQEALKPNPLSEVNYVNLLIESETRDAKYGWEARVQVLYEIRKKAELLQKIPSADIKMYWSDEDIAKFLESV